MPTLTIRSGLLKGRQFTLDRDTVIGRGATADLSLADPGVSRRHARLSRQGGAWVVEDLGSANGTMVNGWRVSEPARLGDGDAIGVGAVLAEYNEPAAPVGAVSGPAVQYRDAEPAVLITMKGDQPEAGTDQAARLRFLGDFARIGTLVFDEPALVSFIAAELLELVPGADRSVVLTCEDDELVPRAVRTRSGQTPEIIASRQLLRDVMDKREAVLAIDTLADQRYVSSESMLAIGIRAAICAPMMFQGEIYGVVQVDSASPGVPFKEADVALVLSLASQLGMALGYARLHGSLVERELVERDMALARRIQQQFLPEGQLALPGYGVAVEYHPALGVSGDFYDLIELDRGRIGLVVGDVSGKGVSAALYASKLTTDLRYQATGQLHPGDILARTNAVLSRRHHEGMFATVTVVVLDPASGAIELSSAGHPLPFLRHGDGRVSTVGQSGSAPIGLDADAEFPQFTCELGPGDALVLYTDGVIEALNEQQELFDEARTIDVIRQSDGSASDILGSLRSAVASFVGAAAQSDDITMLAILREVRPTTTPASSPA